MPGPILRFVLLFGASNGALHDALIRYAPQLGRSSGKWIQVHWIGGPRFRDSFADSDRQERGVRPETLQQEWSEVSEEFGGEVAARVIKDDEAMLRWGVDSHDVPCLLSFHPGETEPSAKIGLGEQWSEGIEDAVIESIVFALDEENLVAHIDSQAWECITRDRLDELVDWIAALVAQGVLRELGRKMKGEAHLNQTDERILSKLEQSKLPLQTKEIAKSIGSKTGTIGKNLARLVNLRLVEKNSGYRINGLGRLRLGNRI